MKKLMQNKKIWLPLIIAAALYLIVVLFVLPRRQEQDEELVNKTKLILITPTYDRITQRADMIRVSNTFKHLENILWIVVEDSATKSFHLAQFLKQTGIEHVHLNAQNTEPNPNKHRGVAQRNAALDYIRANPNLCNAVVYFADDDNSYDLRLFKEMRKVTTVGVFYVGLINQAYMGAEGPSVKIGEDAKPKVVGWLGRAVATRTYRIDMAGFAFSARYVCSNPRVRFENSMAKWFLEDLFLARIGVPVSELQVFTDKVLAFHTKTVIPNVGPYTRDWVIPFGGNTSPVPTTETQAPSQAPAPSVTGKTQLTMTGAELEKKFNQVGVIIENMQALGQYSTGVCKFRLGEVRTLKHSADLMGNECEPWMSRYSVEYLERFVAPTMRILEWGSGTSSFWWLTRAGHLTSIEHYPKWYKTVKEQIEQFPPQIARKWRGVPVKVEGVETLKRGDDYQTDLDYSEYYSAKMLPNDEKFDIILVDGRRRIQCFKRAMQLIQPHGGVIVLDNSKRERYREIFKMAPPQWTMKQFGSGDEETTMWLTRP